jgi:DNA modification methylase
MSPVAFQQVRNTIVPGDYVEVMRRVGSACADFILTDPAYLCRYRPRDGQSVVNDDRDDWLEPAFAEMYRLLKPDSLCLSFYGWLECRRQVHRRVIAALWSGAPYTLPRWASHSERGKFANAVNG